MVQLTQFKQQIEQAQESTGQAVVPSGEYVVACVSTENLPNSARTGHYIKNMYEIQEGEYQGQQLRDIINYDNPNETARNIAFATIKALGVAIGKQEPLEDTNELLGKRIIAVVETKDGKNAIIDKQTGLQRVDNEGKPLFYKDVSIKRYKPLNNVSTAPTPQSTNNYQPPKPTNNNGFPFPQ